MELSELEAPHFPDFFVFVFFFQVERQCRRREKGNAEEWRKKQMEKTFAKQSKSKPSKLETLKNWALTALFSEIIINTFKITCREIIRVQIRVEELCRGF